MVAARFAEVETARDCRVSIWNVRNVCETNGWFWICVGMVMVILTVLSGVPSGISISDDCSQQKETAENAAWRRQMKRARTPCTIFKILTTAWNPDGTGVICRSKRPADADGTGATCRRESLIWRNWCGLPAQELQVLLVRLQQEPLPSPFSSPTVAMQGPTQNVQNELMDSPMEMGAQEQRERRKVRLNDTLPSEMSKRSVVKAKSAHPSMLASMMERLGSTVLEHFLHFLHLKLFTF